MRRESRSAHRKVRICLYLALGLPLAATVAVSSAPVTQAQNLAKIVHGKVLGPDGKPLPGSIIYLQDQKTNIVKTLIATSDGGYRYGQLPADSDYKIWARYKDDRSKDKLINSFDTKLDVTLNIQIGGKIASHKWWNPF